MSLLHKAYPTLGVTLLRSCLSKLCHSRHHASALLAQKSTGRAYLSSWWGGEAPPAGGGGGREKHGPHEPLDAFSQRLLLLYGWTAQLLGPLPPPAHKARKQSSRELQCSSAQAPSLPTAPRFLSLTEQQLMQLLDDLLHSSDFGSDGPLAGDPLLLSKTSAGFPAGKYTAFIFFSLAAISTAVW